MVKRIPVLLAALLVGAAPVLAQAPDPPPDAQTREGPPRAGRPARPETPSAATRLPAEATTHHSLTLSDRTLSFSAIAGAHTLADPQGNSQAELATIAYLLDGTDPATRPVSFVVNGGPGASSAWLQLGALGPWRLPMDGSAATPSASPRTEPNQDTWLDFTDLVFLDPVGTGFSRFTSQDDAVRHRIWSVNGDIDSLAETIRAWLVAHHRVASPKFIIGESYGGFRAPLLARTLAGDEGIGVRGLLMISPVLDFGGRSTAFDPLEYVARLPSMAAIARAAHGPVSRADLADVEHYAAGPYLSALLQGEADPAALASLDQQVANFTGLDPALVTRRHGRIDAATFLRDRPGHPGMAGSIYDGTTLVADPFPANARQNIPDPVLEALNAPLTSAALEIYQSQLNWLPDGTYNLLNDDTNRQWNWGNSRRQPEAMDALRAELALDPQLRIIVAQGLYDLITPYFGNQIQLNQVAAGRDRVALDVWPGGHVLYRDDGARKQLRNAGKTLEGAALDPLGP